MDYRKSAQGVLSAIGGKENVVSAAHCATRLRLVVADNSKVNKKQAENVEGVKGCFEAAGQIQIIFGTGTVNKVFDEFVALAGVAAGSKDDVKQAAASKAPWYKRGIKTLGDIFVPIIPAIVATGLLCGLLGGLSRAFPGMSGSGVFKLLDMFSNAALTFLPILIAVSAARIFGGNIFLGAVIGMIMIHPSLINAWSVGDGSNLPTLWSWFGLWNIPATGYQGHVIPVVIAVLLMSKLEKKLHKVVPEMVDLFVTPLCTVLVTGFLTMTIIAPIFAQIETWVLSGAKGLIALPFGIGSFIMGAAYAPTVVAGVHHMYNAIELAMLAENGHNIWMPLATAANVAQGAAALAVAFKSKQAKVKSMALPASLSAFMGITEPAIFGVNVRYMKPFIAGCIGGAAGAVVASITKVFATANGVTGIFGFLITTDCFVGYLFTFLVALVVGFGASFVLYKDEEEEVVEEKTEVKTASGTVLRIKAPLSGEAVALKDVPDESFSSKALGEGVAIIPTGNKATITAPADGIVESICDTKHAVGLTLDNGAEMLIHVGLNTVELKGKFYEAHVKEGDRVKAGQTLITFDANAISKAGYNVITPVLITNPDDFGSVSPVGAGKVNAGEIVIEARK